MQIFLSHPNVGQKSLKIFCTVELLLLLVLKQAAQASNDHFRKRWVCKNRVRFAWLMLKLLSRDVSSILFLVFLLFLGKLTLFSVKFVKINNVLCCEKREIHYSISLKEYFHTVAKCWKTSNSTLFDQFQTLSKVLSWHFYWFSNTLGCWNYYFELFEVLYSEKLSKYSWKPFILGPKKAILVQFEIASQSKVAGRCGKFSFYWVNWVHMKPP